MKKEQKELVENNNWNEEAVEAYLELGLDDDKLENFEESYQGEWDNDETFTQELLEDTGDLPEDLPGYIHIDWEGTARDIMMDYTKENGHYFRNI